MYSGTVAAAIEGYFFGIDAIAFSQIERGWAHLDCAAKVAQLVVERFLENKAKRREAQLLNVNIPNLPFEQLQGIVATRLGRRHHAESVIREMRPRGFPIYWVGADGQPKDWGEGTDFWAVRSLAVSVTPLRVDLPDYSSVSAVESWLAK